MLLLRIGNFHLQFTRKETYFNWVSSENAAISRICKYLFFLWIQESGSDTAHASEKWIRKKNLYGKSVYNPEQLIPWQVRFAVL